VDFWLGHFNPDSGLRHKHRHVHFRSHCRDRVVVARLSNAKDGGTQVRRGYDEVQMKRLRQSINQSIAQFIYRPQNVQVYLLTPMRIARSASCRPIANTYETQPITDQSSFHWLSVCAQNCCHFHRHKHADKHAAVTLLVRRSHNWEVTPSLWASVVSDGRHRSITPYKSQSAGCWFGEFVATEFPPMKSTDNLPNLSQI